MALQLYRTRHCTKYPCTSETSFKLCGGCKLRNSGIFLREVGDAHILNAERLRELKLIGAETPVRPPGANRPMPLARAYGQGRRVPEHRAASTSFFSSPFSVTSFRILLRPKHWLLQKENKVEQRTKLYFNANMD